MTTDGEFKWAYSYGSRTDETAFDIAVSGSDLYLTGRFCEILGGTGTSKMDFGGYSLNSTGQNGNIYLAKFDLSKLPTSNNNLEQFTQRSLSLFPNPANNLLYIDGFITGQELDYHIYQTNGKLAQSGAATNQLDISILPKGMYLLRVNNGAQQFQARFVKE